ncbi:MAG TPA: ABC transporter permease [Thermoanaerobaculia bacterium]|nr:ABC transporter permease [Thermoanaerobaculia bacterium]
MGLPHGVRRAFRWPLSQQASRRDLDEEVRFHLETCSEELVADGWEPDAARAEALRRFGDLQRVRSECRRIDRRRVLAAGLAGGLAATGRDLAAAGRQLARSPGFFTLAVLTLAVGIGATTALFGILRAVVLEPLPYPDPQRVVFVFEGAPWGRGAASAGNFHDWRQHSRAFTALTATRSASFNLADEEAPERVLGQTVSAEYFRVFAVPPERGRVFTAADDQPGAPPVTVLSHRLWQRRFGGDPDVVGTELRLGGVPHTIVGVMPARFAMTGEDEELWVPLRLTPAQMAEYDGHSLLVFGRLAPGHSVGSAQEDLRAVAGRLDAAAHDPQRDLDPLVEPVLDVLVEDHRPRLLVLFGAVALVLLIGCVNVANLLLVRGATRRKEMAVRTALGGSRTRLVRQLLAESLVLALAGAAVGLLLAHLLLPLLVRLAPTGVPRLGQAELDGPVLLFALALAAVACVLAGLVPALRASGVRPVEALLEGGRGSRTAARGLGRHALVAVEVALALLLLVGAGLLVRSGRAMSEIDLGLDTAHLLTARLSLPEARYGEPAAAVAAFERLLEEVESLPGVTTATLANQVPLGGGSISNGLQPEGRKLQPHELVQSDMRLVTPSYFETLGLEPVAGRMLTTADRAGGPPVVLVNETAARQLYPGGPAVGRQVACCAAEDDPTRWRTIVGVMPDVRGGALLDEPPPQFYVPLSQAPPEVFAWLQRTMVIVARTGGDPATLVEPLRERVQAVDPELPIYDVATLDDRLEEALAPGRFMALLLTLLGGLGLLLAAVGIYGTIAWLVEQRRYEVGVRMALGADARQVLGMILRQALAPLAVGIVLGGAAAVAGGGLLEAVLYGVAPGDPATFAAVAAILLAVGGAASLVPARRATRVDPARTLTGA